jgi:hypothetical protein
MRNYTIVLKNKTLFYTSMDEAIRMARFIGFPVSNIKPIDLY